MNHHIGTPSMALVTESVDVTTAFKQAIARLRRKTRHLMCTVIHGGHELYRARTDTKLFQQCLLCGYETTGWTIDRRDKRLHLVSNNSQSSAIARR
jgi:hypothetical protein